MRRNLHSKFGALSWESVRRQTMGVTIRWGSSPSSITSDKIKLASSLLCQPIFKIQIANENLAQTLVQYEIRIHVFAVCYQKELGFLKV